MLHYQRATDKRTDQQEKIDTDVPLSCGWRGVKRACGLGIGDDSGRVDHHTFAECVTGTAKATRDRPRKQEGDTLASLRAGKNLPTASSSTAGRDKSGSLAQTELTMGEQAHTERENPGQEVGERDSSTVEKLGEAR